MRTLLASALFLSGCMVASAGTICPAAAAPTPFPHPPDAAATGCNVVVTINAAGGASVAIVDATSYDNSDDTIIGVVNNSGAPLSTLSLSGSGVFGFEGDGMCTFTFVGSSYCTASQRAGTDPGDYAGPTSTFSNFSTGNSGTITFSPAIAASGGTSYFSLEGVPTANLQVVINPGGGGTSTPAPTSLILASLGLGALALYQIVRK